MFKNRFFIYLIIVLVTSCAQVTSLNLKKHHFGKIPTKIIWIQVAGLSDEHIALLKFGYPTSKRKSSFEEALCMGSTWEYNLYDIRPKPEVALLTQLTGKKNLKGECEDYDKKPIWEYTVSKNYRVGVFEGKSLPRQSLINVDKCGDKYKKYLDNTVVWKMGKKQGKEEVNLFHATESLKYEAGKRYFDKSCLTGKCYTSLSKNIEKTFFSFQKNTKNYLYIVRDFSYYNALKKRNLVDARKQLIEIDKVFKTFQELSLKNDDMLVLLTSASPLEIDFPKAGKGWENFQKKRRFASVKNSKLISKVFVSGARAENFCGIYDQSEVMARIFSGAKQQGLEFSIINPFN